MAKASKRPTSMNAYLRSMQDKKEDRFMSDLTGMTMREFKKTPQARSIDRDVVALNQRRTKRK
ncbi:hypothetical protein [Acetobacter ascendens]|uniref:hypothetical protein n=1 Tax=Acetobacter ascendens TaxID=481146 RepID=UPI000875E5D7|nr:hypothetical protein [Acetobacter ascendens]AOW48377.1 hypothetical protein A4R89_01990 [Acetobacter ascendens]